MQNGTFKKCHHSFIFLLPVFGMTYLRKNIEYSVIFLIP